MEIALNYHVIQNYMLLPTEIFLRPSRNMDILILVLKVATFCINKVQENQ